MDQAADLYTRWLQVYPDEHLNWSRAAAVYAAIGDVDRYRGACREMLDRFEDLGAEKAQVAERTVMACALAPESVPDFSRVERLSQRSVTPTTGHGFRGAVLARGLVDYRAGRHEQAVEWLNRLAPDAGGLHWDACAFAALAMANHRLGHADQARASLDSARATLARKPQNISRDGPGLEWLHCQILYREAEQQLAK